MNESKVRVIESYLREGVDLRLATLSLRERIAEAAEAITKSFKRGGKLIAFGNGGSAADAQHIVAELGGRFRRDRAPLPAIAITTNSSVVTAIANDYAFEEIFARQVQGLAKPGDVVIGISTSGKSKNVIRGLKVAREAHATTIGLSGKQGDMKSYCDVLLAVPGEATSLIQEVHISIGHVICLLVEEELFG